MRNWEILNLGEIFTITSGGTPNRNNREFYINGNIPWIKTGDLKGKYVNKPDEYITKEALKYSSAKLFPPKTVLLAMYGATIGACSILPCEAATNQACAALLPTKKCNEIYLYYFLKSILHELTTMGVGGAQPNISCGKIKQIQIPLPPISIQQKIAAILDAADEYRQKTKALLDKYDQLAQSLFLNMFGDPTENKYGWPLKPFKYFASFDTIMTTNFVKYADFPHIGIANIEKDTGSLIGYKKVSEENLISGKYIFSDKHIIYSKIRPNLNKVALPTFSGLCSADSYPILVKKENANRIFFAFLLKSPSFLAFILSHSDRTNIPKANKAQMSLYFGIAPPLNLQNQFAERIQLIDAQKQQAQASLQKAEELFTSLLQQAFNGGLIRNQCNPNPQYRQDLTMV